MSTLATAGLRLLELAHGDHLLRFNAPLEAELEVFPGEGASVWIPVLETGASGRSVEEALAMLSDLIITMFLTYREGAMPLSSGARAQWYTLQSLTEGLFVRQP